MFCGFAAAGRGDRPEHSYTATTSRQTPSLPTPCGFIHPFGDPRSAPTPRGFKRPFGFTGNGSQTMDPARRRQRLDPPESGPFPPESRSAARFNRQAASLVASDLLSILRLRGLMPSQRRRPEGAAASTKARGSLTGFPRYPPPNLLDKPIGWCSPWKFDDTPYYVQPPNWCRSEGPSFTQSRTSEGVIPLLLEVAEESSMDQETCTETDREPDEPGSGEHPSPAPRPALAAPVVLMPEDFFAEARAGTGWEEWFSGARRRPEEADREHAGGDPSTEVAEPVQPPTCAERSMIEVGTSRQPLSQPTPSPPVSELTQREVTDVESTAVVADPPSRCQLSNQREDHFASTWDELHQLLVADANVSQQEYLPCSISVPQEQATGHEVHPKEHESTFLDSPDVSPSFPGCAGVASSVKTEVLEPEVEHTCMMDVEETSQRPSSSRNVKIESSQQMQPPASLPLDDFLQSPPPLSFSEDTEVYGDGNSDFDPFHETHSPSPQLPIATPQLPIATPQQTGFTPQDAVDALERANGNVAMVLLILIIRGIVVST